MGMFNFFRSAEILDVIFVGGGGFFGFPRNRLYHLASEKDQFLFRLYPGNNRWGHVAVMTVAFEQFTYDHDSKMGPDIAPASSVSGLDHSVR